MPSAEELRAEVRRLLATVGDLSDPLLKRELAGQMVVLAQLAEAIERIKTNPELLRTTIARCRALLADGTSDETLRKIVEQVLAEAETLWAARAAGPDGTQQTR
ncbi:MAG: hypothetical protein WA459_15265 [Stellaceae bacterium]